MKTRIRPVSKVKRNIDNLNSIGDDCKDVFEKQGDLNAAVVAIKAYNGATNASRAQLIYKKMTGAPKAIDFLED